MESFRNACNRYVNILHSMGMRQHQLHLDGVIASRWDAYLFCYLCRHFASVMLRLASLISHNLRCIPAYAHQIPMGFFQFWEILPFLFWKGVFAPILAKFLVSLHSKIRMKLDNELLMNLLAVTLGKS